jgi:hypothetical protein
MFDRQIATVFCLLVCLTPAVAIAAGKTVTTPSINFTGQQFLSRSLNTSPLYFTGQEFIPKTVATAPLNFTGQSFIRKTINTAAITFTGMNKTHKKSPILPLLENKQPPSLSSDVLKKHQAAGLKVEKERPSGRFGAANRNPTDQHSGQRKQSIESMVKLERVTGNKGRISGIPLRTGSLQIDQIIIGGRPSAGQPINLTVVLRNASRNVIPTNRETLTIHCTPLGGITCQTLTRTVKVPFSLGPGEARKLHVPAAILPQSKGQFNISITPQPSRQNAGKTVSLVVRELSTAKDVQIPRVPERSVPDKPAGDRGISKREPTRMQPAEKRRLDRDELVFPIPMRRQ